MPKYIVQSESPIHVRAISAPGEPDIGLPGEPEAPDTGGPGGWPSFPERPGHGLPIQIPPKDEWPPLPPWLQPGVGLPIPPTVEHPMVPVEPEVTDPPEIWPPIRVPPEMPDLSGKTLALVRVFVSRHVNYLAWVIIDNEEAKAKAKAAIEAIKSKLPAGGIAGRPPQTGNRPENR